MKLTIFFVAIATSPAFAGVSLSKNDPGGRILSCSNTQMPQIQIVAKAMADKHPANANVQALFQSLSSYSPEARSETIRKLFGALLTEDSTPEELAAHLAERLNEASADTVDLPTAQIFVDAVTGSAQ